ncbi:MAG: transglutaminase-like domain-containing protein, partial [Candidatus Bathyarchaeia archaeon]
WHFNTSMLGEVARRVAGGEKRVLIILKKFITWIAENMRYATSEVPRYPNETLSQQMGDCDDQANLLIALCRAVGIPAYLQVGCIYMPWVKNDYTQWSGRLLIREMGVGWHGWAMVYVPPWGWLPVDLTYVTADLRRDPLSAIVHSAVIEHYTFHYANIIVTDYVSETRSIKEFLESREFYIYEEDVMEREVREEVVYPRPPAIIVVYPAILVLKLAEIIALYRRLLQNANNLYALKLLSFV